MKEILLLITLVPSLLFAQTAQESIQHLKQTASAFNQVAEKGQAAVVSISTTRVLKGLGSFYDHPFFKEYYNDYRRQNKREGLGSGVLVSSDGYILTNHHVTQAADEIEIVLSDGREFEATVIGTDQKTDLALLKIEGKNFPYISMIDSNNLKVGEWAIAVGNPFGLRGTVTVGIVSATGRAGVMDVENYADFIQTDAAINPGNSGGALLNIDGELMGINTAIFSQSGGYMGIGFAIPSNMAKRVMEDLIQFGQVQRGLLGVTIQPITDEVMQEYQLSSKKGALILEVRKKSAADRAGLKEGDIIIKLGGKEVADHLSLRSRVSEIRPNEESSIVVLRHNKEIQLSITLLDHKSELGNKKIIDNYLGLELHENSPYLQEKYGIEIDYGLVITDVLNSQTSQKHRISEGQVITKVNGKEIKSTKEYLKLTTKSKGLVLSVVDEGYEYSLVIRY